MEEGREKPDKTYAVLKIVLFLVFMAGTYEVGKLDGMFKERRLSTLRFMDMLDESARTGQPFAFLDGRFQLLEPFDAAQGRSWNGKHIIACRTIWFLWPEDEETLPTPVNRFGQYGSTWKSAP